MSNFSKSRVLALQLLTRLCGLAGGHGSVADSLSMLRLKFGEPVRFKFLIGEQKKASSDGSFCPFSPDFWHSCKNEFWSNFWPSRNASDNNQGYHFLTFQLLQGC